MSAHRNTARRIAACVAKGGFLCGQFPAEEDRRVLLASHELGLNGAPIVLLYLAHLFSNIMVYAVSSRSREHLLRHNPDYFAEILAYGIPDVAEKAADPFPLSHSAEGKRIFALVGTVERRKGQDVLLDAVGLLPEDAAKQCFFVFVGPVFHPDIGDRVHMAASCQADKFQYIPQLPMEKMPAFYSAVDCVVCASRDDPEPVTVVEGCQFSKSVICSEHTGTAALLAQNHAGFVYGGDDPAELAHSFSLT